MNKKTIAIIGAGPAGSQTAYWLAKYGYKVDVYEEHPVIGKPVQCTGIISKNLKKIIPVDRFVINKVKGAVFYSKHQKFELKTDETQAFIVDRTKMDQFLAERARKQGANFYHNHKFLGFKKQNKFILKFYYRTKIVTKEADILVGADGPLSKVAKQAGLYKDRIFLNGIQAKVKGEFDKNHVKLFFGSVCPDFFAWIVPESEKYARIGLASKRNSRKLFNNFLSKFDYQIINKQAGLIPLYKNICLQKNNVYLVGDAALQVKATTAGGVVMSLLAAKCLADSIRTNIPYKLLLKKWVNYNLFLTKKIRKKLNKFNDNDYDSLLKLMNSPRIINLLKKKGDMDFPAKFALSLLVRQPLLLRYLF
ncbi:NAD(P)/FAD-dependent oxidoreductase [Candidatus Woesearchaeota archaeon]|nr:NAD(P)/FAD-dependent oxidoreductase [Candidatus Woesearchaeota archaeon]